VSDDDMTTPSDEELDDVLDDVLDAMRAALAVLPDARVGALEPVPASVLEGARWVHDWVNMDAELAELTHDSDVDLGFASVRSTSPLRHVRFECGSYEIHIDVEPTERGISMTGTISPPAVGTARAVVGGVSHEGAIDALGTFLIDNVNHGVVMAYVTTEHSTIRLGSFEV
jgi:hypothetical protein